MASALQIYFDLSGHEYWFRRELDFMVETMLKSQTSAAMLVGSAQQADCVLRVGGCPQLTDNLSTCFKRYQPRSPREFIWDMGDSPTGAWPGLYVSLPSYMYDGKRHRAFCLPVRCNEIICPYDLGDATFLYGFFGAVTSGVRARMVNALRVNGADPESLIEVRSSIWNQMWDRSGLKAKVEYAENLRRCRFNLCPRGSVLAGAGSRLYETMQAARVPVIISDWITLPEGVDWNSCAVRVRERDMSRIPEILRSHSDRWPQMAASARSAWETHFSQESLLGELGRQLRTLLAVDNEGTMAARVSSITRITLGMMAWKPRQYYARAQRLRARRSRTSAPDSR